MAGGVQYGMVQENQNLNRELHLKKCKIVILFCRTFPKKIVTSEFVEAITHKE